MATLEQFVEEFKNFELDPESIQTERIYREFLAITSTQDLSSTARCRAANAAIGTMAQAVLFKAGRCHYWEKKLSAALDNLRAKKRLHYINQPTGPSGGKVSKEMLEAMIESDAEVQTLAERYANANASRFFWEKLQDGLRIAAERVENSVMSHGTDAKIQGLK